MGRGEGRGFLSEMFLLGADLFFFYSLFDALQRNRSGDSAPLWPIQFYEAFPEPFECKLSVFCLGSMFGGDYGDPGEGVP